ncbi:uncharacterized protein [Rutidosis leptorrhynchoides]|uniref:uncharacterized protein isoform X2 n=1 Tax=Rutidosis leptorrhynchoides TaxID=125765 RepID=UPI003A9A628F
MHVENPSGIEASLATTLLLPRQVAVRNMRRYHNRTGTASPIINVRCWDRFYNSCAMSTYFCFSSLQFSDPTNLFQYVCVLCFVVRIFFASQFCSFKPITFL